MRKYLLRFVCVPVFRNDWSILTKTLANEVLRLAIKERNPEGALQHLRQQLIEMRAGRLDIKNFVISKQLHSYEPKTKSAHTTMCLRIKKKDPAAAPVLGTKVSYVLKRGSGDVSDRAFPPEEVSPSEIDLQFYFERQVLKPLTEILAPLIKGGEAKLRRLLTNEHGGHQEISKVFTALKRTTPAAAPKSTKQKFVVEKKKQQCADLASMFRGKRRAAEPAEKKIAVKRARVQVKSKDIVALFTKN
jgi:hypothetical protein